MKTAQQKSKKQALEQDSLSAHSYRVSALGRMRGSTAVDFPLVSVVKKTLFPLVVVLALVFAVLWSGELFSSYYSVLAILGFLISAYVFDEVSFYRALRKFPVIVAFSNICIRWLTVVSILFLIGYLTEFQHHFSLNTLLLWFIITPPFLLVAQVVARMAIYYIIAATQQSRTAVIVGANQLGYELFNKINDDRLLHIRVTGFFDDRHIQRLPFVTARQKLGELKDLAEYVKKKAVNIIYVCLPMVAQPRIIKLLDELRDTTASIYFVPDIFMFDLIQARIDRITGIPVVAICETPFFGFRGVSKRVSDIVLASLILLLIWPLMLIIAACVKFSSPGPIMFKQRRYGLDGEEIVVYKFRTMRVCEDGDWIEQAKREDTRVTPLGAFLRRTSLDELPQFFNVLTGKMSIVGPRPHAVAHNEMYRKVIKGYMVRHKVRPGITGWAQVNGFRGETETLDKMKARVEFDLDYLRHWSLALDIWILIKTAFLIFRDSRAY